MSISDPRSPEARLLYLEEYHHITQHLIGIARCHMNPEQLNYIAPYMKKLHVLEINRLRQLGATAEKIVSVFNYTAEEVRSAEGQIAK